MDSQLQKTHDAHGHHYDEHDALTHATGPNEDEHHEKKSMMTKVKEKAKKLKNKITGHGHDHEHDDEDDDDDDDDDDNETVVDPDVHGAPMYDSPKVGQLGGPDAILSHQRHNLEKPSEIAEDRHTVTKPLSSHGPTPPISSHDPTPPVSSHGSTPPVSTGAYGANLSESSGIGHGLGLGLGHHQTSGHEVHPDKWKSKVGQPTGMEEDPFAPNSTRLNTPIHVTDPTHGMKHVSSDPASIHGHQGHDDHKGDLKSDSGKSTGHQGHDAHAGDLKSDLGKSTVYQGHDAHIEDLKSDLGKSTGHQGHDAHAGDLKSDLGKSTGYQGHDAHIEDLKSDLGKSAHIEDLKSDLGKSTGHQGHDAHAGDLKSDLGKSTGYQHDAHIEDLKSDLGKSTGHQGHDAHKVESKGSKGDLEKSTVIPDPRAQKDPSRLGSRPLNFESKVTDPTHTGGKEADLSKMQHSFENLGVGSNPKSYDPNHPENLRHDTLTGIGSNRKTDPNHPENLPHDTLTGNQSSKSRSYTEKISSSDEAAADKAAAAKDVIASKLGYSGQNQSTGSDETDKNTGSYMGSFYEKVVDAGSTVISKVQGTVSGTGSGTETVPPQVHHEGSGAVAMDEGKEADKGVSVKEYLVETSRPGDEDKALSGVISHALHRGDDEESAKKSEQDKPMGTVTESVEVRSRLGTDRHEEHQQQQQSGDVSADKNVSERLRDAVGSWFGGKGDAPQGTTGTSYVTDQGLSSNPSGDQKS